AASRRRRGSGGWGWRPATAPSAAAGSCTGRARSRRTATTRAGAPWGASSGLILGGSRRGRRRRALLRRYRQQARVERTPVRFIIGPIGELGRVAGKRELAQEVRARHLARPERRQVAG